MATTGPPRIPSTYLEGFNFTGGWPTPPDLAPSIVFTIAYALCLPVLAWRVADPSSRTLLLLRPGFFNLLRFALYLLRAVMSVNAYNFHHLQAESSLVQMSFMLLILPLLDLWRRHVLTTLPRPNHPKWMRPVVVVAYLALITSIILSIACAAMLDVRVLITGTMAERLWRASYILALACVVLGLLLSTSTHFLFRLRKKGTVYLVVNMLLCLITCVYRITQMYTADPDAPIRSLTAFYVLEGVADLAVLVALLAINMNTWFPGDMLRKAAEKQELDRHIRALTVPPTRENTATTTATRNGSLAGPPLEQRKWSV